MPHNNPSQPTILITAFEPFGGRAKNASAEALTQLANLKYHHARIMTALLPVEADKAFIPLRAAIRRSPPAFVLCLGEARRDALCLETTGYNERRFTVPDNAGRVFDGTPVDPAAPQSYRVSLPLDQMLHAVEAIQVPVRLSDDPGRYLCNEVLFRVLAYIETHHLDTKAGFIHIPHLPEAATDPDYPSMPTEQVIQGLITILDILVQQHLKVASTME